MVKVFLFVLAVGLLLMWLKDSKEYDKTVNYEGTKVYMGNGETFESEEFNRWVEREGL